MARTVFIVDPQCGHCGGRQFIEPWFWSQRTDSPWAYVCLNCGRSKAETQEQCAIRIGGPTYRQRMEQAEAEAIANGTWLKKHGPEKGFKRRREAIHIAEILVEFSNLALAEVLGYVEGDPVGTKALEWSVIAGRPDIGTAT